MDQKIGVLLINVGTPDAPTKEAVKAFLEDFLSDPLVVDYPAWLWKPILERIILRSRPQKSARLYERIWEKTGSPILNFTRRISSNLDQKNPKWEVAFGMRYGNPHIATGLEELKDQGATHLVILPLYPQYSSTTSLTAIQKVELELSYGMDFRSVTTVKDYHGHPAYITALADSIKRSQIAKGKPDITLFSYHGVPKRLVTKRGEPYQDQCLATTRMVAQQAGMKPTEYAVSFQSRFGPEAWLAPSTNDTLAALAETGHKKIHVICPGFAADCLETLEEIAVQGEKIFTSAGGDEFHYIPALNDNKLHIQALAEVIQCSLDQI
jgi:ferrochelatase